MFYWKYCSTIQICSGNPMSVMIAKRILIGYMIGDFRGVSIAERFVFIQLIVRPGIFSVSYWLIHRSSKVDLELEFKAARSVGSLYGLVVKFVESTIWVESKTNNWHLPVRIPDATFVLRSLNLIWCQQGVVIAYHSAHSLCWQQQVGYHVAGDDRIDDFGITCVSECKTTGWLSH